MKRIIDFDKWLFLKINREGVAGFLDTLMPIIRQPLVWIPFYLFLALFIILNFPKKAVSWLFTLGVTVGITDFISSSIIKPYFGRLRPCNDPTLADQVRLLANYCGQNGSFTSSHASNHFAIAMFLFFTLKEVWGKYCFIFFVWAACICYAQIYVGVHFPIDIIGGTIVGLTTGWMAAFIFKKTGGLIPSPEK